MRLSKVFSSGKSYFIGQVQSEAYVDVKYVDVRNVIKTNVTSEYKLDTSWTLWILLTSLTKLLTSYIFIVQLR